MTDNDRLQELDRRIADADAKLRKPDADVQPVEPEWDPFAERRGKRQAQREPATPAVTWGGQPIPSTPGGTSGSWGAGTGRPTEPVSSLDAKMGRLIRDGARWLRRGIPPDHDDPGPVR
ncbi:MAG: hypothetical protein H0U37_02790 [Chloroflexi bacterium]|nr:hypothetical protein [Chloroflexota bacterium]